MRRRWRDILLRRERGVPVVRARNNNKQESVSQPAKGDSASRGHWQEVEDMGTRLLAALMETTSALRGTEQELYSCHHEHC